jgi:hypothetical protein
MSHHLNKQGQFQSDQSPYLAPDEIVLSFRDPASMEALHDFADLTDDDDLAVAIVKRLDAIAVEYGQDSALASTGEAVERLELENLSG